MLHAVIIGAGPAGLAAGCELSGNGARVAVLERMNQVGGLSRTIKHAGCRFDIGPHRFFTKNEEINRLFLDVVGEDAIHVSRLTRIFHNDKFFDYPLTPLNALFGVGVGASISIFGSYLLAQLREKIAPREPENFEQWVTSRFGAQLFQTFFKSYTEKIWGLPCAKISADWAGQRIKGLSLGAAVRNAVGKNLGLANGKTVKTLVDEFMFPRLGAGQFYEKMAARIEAGGGSILIGRRAKTILREGPRVRGVIVADDSGNEEILEAEHYMSSAPLTEMIEMMDPAAPDEVVKACRNLSYRDHVGVHLKLAGETFPDNWIYVHSERVRMARVVNHRNFSPAMADRAGTSPLTVEYFTSKRDRLWNLSDAELIGLAVRELGEMNIARESQLLSAFVVRSEKAYPVIATGFQRNIETIRAWLDRLENLIPIGRSGMFKYNNQDHAIYTGLLAARTALGLGRYDPWLVNNDADYHESAPLESGNPHPKTPGTS